MLVPPVRAIYRELRTDRGRTVSTVQTLLYLVTVWSVAMAKAVASLL